MPFYIVKQNITEMQVDAIVNTANTSLQMGAGICGTIFKKAGTQKCRQPVINWLQSIQVKRS